MDYNIVLTSCQLSDIFGKVTAIQLLHTLFLCLSMCIYGLRFLHKKVKKDHCSLKLLFKCAKILDAKCRMREDGCLHFLLENDTEG